jgi:hypothetical protein
MTIHDVAAEAGGSIATVARVPAVPDILPGREVGTTVRLSPDLIIHPSAVPRHPAYEASAVF